MANQSEQTESDADAEPDDRRDTKEKQPIEDREPDDSGLSDQRQFNDFALI